MNRLKELTDKVKDLCSKGVTSPVIMSQLQIELENEILDIRLLLAKEHKRRSIEFYKTLRKYRYESDVIMSYNEASAATKADLAHIDRNIEELKIYRDYFENLSSILKGFVSASFSD